jgi:hypothetical protein
MQQRCASILASSCQAEEKGCTVMNPLASLLFYFPGLAFRRYGPEVLAELTPRDMAVRVWNNALRLQKDLGVTRPHYSPGVNLILRHMEWDAALYRAARAEGLPEPAAGRLVEETNWKIFGPVSGASFKLSRLRSASLLKRVQWVLDLMFQVIFTAPFRRNTYQTTKEIAFDVTECPLAKYFRDQSIPELTRYAACNLDHRMAIAWRMELTRTQTIAEGHPLCDFKFRASDNRTAQQ